MSWLLTSSSAKPRRTRNGRSWEKKDKNCTDEEKPNKGSQWDHVVLDVESRAVISLVCGKRTKENTEQLIKDFAQRANDGKPPGLFTTDADWCYKGALLSVYGEWVYPEPTGKPGRPRQPYQVVPDMQYVMVKKARKGGRVVNVTTEQVYGTPDGLSAALSGSLASTRVNTAFVERQHDTDRHLNRRKARKTLGFSKDREFHICQSWVGMTYYNFCWDHRSLRIGTAEGRYVHRSPMMALGVTGHIWSVEEMATYQTIAGH